MLLGSEFSSAGCYYLCSWRAKWCGWERWEWAGEFFISIRLPLLFARAWERLEAMCPWNTIKEVVGNPWSQGAPLFGTVSSMRRLVTGKKSVSIASKIGNQLVLALLNQNFQRKAVRSEDFSTWYHEQNSKSSTHCRRRFWKSHWLSVHFPLRITSIFQGLNDAQMLNWLWKVTFFLSI